MEGLFSHGAPHPSLPYPAMTSMVMSAIRAAISEAWQLISLSGIDLRTANEIKINEAIQGALNFLLDDESTSRPFSSRIFETVNRGGELRNFDGTKLEKRPDLVFRLVGRHPFVHDRAYWGLFVECKIIDDTNLRQYQLGGITRFLRGDYAWAMQHGMMLAYVRCDATHAALVEALENAAGPMNLVGTLMEGQDLISIHRRLWTYPHNGVAPGHIKLLHRWLTVPLRTE